MVNQLQQRIGELQALIKEDPHSVNVARYEEQIEQLEHAMALPANQEKSQDNQEFPIKGPESEDLPQSIDPKGKGFGVSDVARVFVYIISFKWLIQLFSKGEQSIQLGIFSPKPEPAKVTNPTFESIPRENTAETQVVTFDVFKEQLGVLQDPNFYDKDESIQKIAVETVTQYMNEQGNIAMGFDYQDQATKILDLTSDFSHGKRLQGEDRQIKDIDKVLEAMNPESSASFTL